MRTRLETLFPRQRERVRYAPHLPAAHLRPPCEAQTGGQRVYLTSCIHRGELLPLEYFPRSFFWQVRMSIFNHNVSATGGFFIAVCYDLFNTKQDKAVPYFSDCGGGEGGIGVVIVKEGMSVET